MDKQILMIESASDSVTSKVWEVVEENKNKPVDYNVFTGMYLDDWFGKVKISVENGQLWITSLRSPKLNGPMYFYKANTFAIRWEYQDMNCDAFASFTLDTEGNATEIRMKGISPVIDFSFDFQDLDLRLIEK